VFPRILAISIYLLIVLTTRLHAQALPSSIPEADALKLWNQYKSSFVQPDGRVIDVWQNSISHSESQGYGLLNSVMFDDRESFQMIWQWTRNNLQARKDNLLPWAWGKRANNGLWQIIDYNNATDGDVLVAYALIQASVKWKNQEYRSEGLKIIEGIRKHLPVRWKDKTYLLPAYYGFQRDDKLILNPSYLIVSAYRTFAEFDDQEFWRKVYDDSLDLMQKSRFGKLKLPADWISLNSTGISLWEEKNPFYGYEAIRTILYLSWEKKSQYPDGIYDMLKIYEKQGYLPLYVDLQKNTISLDDAPAGFYAVYARAAEKSGQKQLSQKLFKTALEKAATEKNDYYSMTLLLLSIHTLE
jgi:endo-1,4-beta-D-glucanase Y